MPLPARSPHLRLLLPLAALLLFSGCEKMVERQDYFPMRDGNTWEYRLLDHSMVKALAAGKKIETEPSADEKLSTNKKTEEEFTAQLRPSAPVSAESKTPAPNTQGGDLLPTPLTEMESKPVSKSASPSGISADAAPSGLKPARRVSLVLHEAVDELTFRSTYGEWDQVWSKKGGYVGLQNGSGRQYLLILPPHTTYRWIAADANGNNLYFEVEAQMDVTTPAGTFHECAVSRQESRDKQEVFKYWFAPEVGLVRRSKYFAGEEVFRQELISYKVRPSSFESRSSEGKEITEALRGKNRGAEFSKKSESTTNINNVPIER